MAKSSRDTILQHVEQAKGALERAQYHLAEIDSFYSGLRHKIEIGEAKDGDFIPVSPTDPYGKYREFIFGLAAAVEELKEVFDQIKDF